VSRLDSTDKSRGVLVPKPKADIYTALLGIALAAILLGILCLCLEMNRYNWDVKPAVTMAAPKQGDTVSLVERAACKNERGVARLACAAIGRTDRWSAASETLHLEGCNSNCFGGAPRERGV
jgi:hypothetical protein